MSFDQIAWLPLCAGVSGVGLVLSFLLMRRRGVAAGTRGLAWSLLPMAAYLTGALPALWQIGTAIAGFFAGVVLSPTVWAGAALTGLSALLFLVSGALRRRRAAPPASSAPTAVAAGPRTPAVPGGAAPRAPQGRPREKAPAAKPADDFSDIEALLKRRGIE